MFVPCPRLVLERTSSASVLGVKRASGPDLPCAANIVYTLSPSLRGAFVCLDVVEQAAAADTAKSGEVTARLEEEADGENGNPNSFILFASALLFA